jgi:hypothetical protein
MSGTALGKLIHACGELRRSVARAAQTFAPDQPELCFDDGDAFGIRGVCRFQLNLERGELSFQFGEGPVDTIEASPDDGSFFCRSNPKLAIEPLGFLRGRLLEHAAQSFEQ